MKKYYFLLLYFSCFYAFGQEIASKEAELTSHIKSWILVNNKINGDIRLTEFDFAKIGYNTMEIRFVQDGSISYRYHSNVEACGGKFLDIDIENSKWERHGAFFVLTLRGGYWSIDDFEFKRAYTIEAVNENDFILKKIDEYYFKRLNDEDHEVN